MDYSLYYSKTMTNWEDCMPKGPDVKICLGHVERGSDPGDGIDPRG